MMKKEEVLAFIKKAKGGFIVPDPNDISIERLKQVKQILYHQSCPDGTASAMICFAAFNALSMAPEFKAVQYNTDELKRMEPLPGQLFVDITPPRDGWEKWKGTDVIVLDHHATSEHITKGLGGVYGENDKYSGARLAYEHVMLPVASRVEWNTNGKSVEFWNDFSKLAMVRDTWKDEHPAWDNACVQAYGLMALGSHEMLAQLRENRFDEGLITRLGERDLGRAKFVASKAARYEVPCKKLGRPAVISIINCTENRLISDACHDLLKSGTDVAVSYFMTFQDNSVEMIVSLRTKEPWAGKMAELMGGGGHAKASGFKVVSAGSISINFLSSIIKDCLDKLT